MPHFAFFAVVFFECPYDRVHLSPKVSSSSWVALQFEKCKFPRCVLRISFGPPPYKAEGPKQLPKRRGVTTSSDLVEDDTANERQLPAAAALALVVARPAYFYSDGLPIAGYPFR